MVIKMNLFSLRSSKQKEPSSLTARIGLTLIFSIIILHSIHLSSPNAIADKVNDVSDKHDDGLAEIVDPFKSTCYEDVKNQAGHILPVRKPLE